MNSQNVLLYENLDFEQKQQHTFSERTLFKTLSNRLIQYGQLMPAFPFEMFAPILIKDVFSALIYQSHLFWQMRNP